MTIREAISRTDELCPNQYETNIKVGWLSRLDGIIYNEVISTHEGNTREGFDGYRESDFDAELLVGFPYGGDIYNYYLQAMISKENGETNRYNDNIVMYNNAYQTFADWYNRTKRPVQRGNWRY